MTPITSRRNPIVKRFRDAARDASSVILLDGLHLIEEATRWGVHVEEVAVAPDGAAASGAQQVLDAAERSGARLHVVSRDVLQAMTPVRTPSGVAALASRPTVALGQALSSQATPLVVMAIDVQDPGNAGAIVRSADAGGATAVIFAGASVDPFGWKALRGSMGSVFHLPVASARIDAALDALRAARIAIVATLPRGGTPVDGSDLGGPLALLLGGEGPGLPPELVDAADLRVSIPMREPVESFNVAVAAGILVYEAARQRRKI